MRILTFLLLLGCGSLYSQKATLGFKSGLNYHLLDNSNASLYFEGEPIKKGLGWQSGALVYFPLSEHFSLNVEVNFQQRRFEEYSEKYSSSNGGQVTYSQIHNWTYLDLPISAKYQLKNGIGFHLGMQYGTMISASKHGRVEHTNFFDSYSGQTYNGNGSSGNGHYVSWGVKEFSGLAGLSYNFKFGLELELRAQRNIFMICDTDYVWDEHLEFKTPIYTFQFNVKYLLPSN